MGKTIERVTALQWKQGGRDPDQTVVKFSTFDLQNVKDVDRSVTFTLSTKDVDRDNDTIDQDGWVLEHYLSNPVVLWGHNYSSTPIGRATQVFQSSKSLRATDEFMPKDLNPFADSIFQMVKGGWLKTVSVGFKALEGDMSEARGGFAFDFTKQELMEHSVVPVPSNPMALVEASNDLGVETLSPYKSWAEENLDTWSKDAGAGLVTRDSLEMVYSIFNTTSYHDMKPKSGYMSDEELEKPLLHIPTKDVNVIKIDSDLPEKIQKQGLPSISRVISPKTAWSIPSLEDYGKGDHWDIISRSEKLDIAYHFALQDGPLSDFDSLALPHHDPDTGLVNPQAVMLCAARLPLDLTSGQQEVAKAHLAQHYHDMNLVPPWESNKTLWDCYEKAVRELEDGGTDEDFATLLRGLNFAHEADALLPAPDLDDAVMLNDFLKNSFLIVEDTLDEEEHTHDEDEGVDAVLEQLIQDSLPALGETIQEAMESEMEKFTLANYGRLPKPN